MNNQKLVNVYKRIKKITQPKMLKSENTKKIKSAVTNDHIFELTTSAEYLDKKI